MGFAHLAPQQRPKYKKADKAVSDARLARTIERENERRMRQKKKGK